jgi:hypothetical protein
MALTRMERAWSAVRRGWNQTVGQYFRYDIYGLRLFGIQITPKRTVVILSQDNGRKFSENQLYYHRIYLVFNSYYVFVPRLERYFDLWH